MTAPTVLDLTLPDYISYDSNFYYQYSTDVVESMSAAEQRVSNWSDYRLVGDLYSPAITESTLNVTLRVTEVLSAIPRPVLLPPELIGSNLNLTWTAVSNATYRLEFNPDLANLTNWNPIPGDVTPVTNTASKLDALTPSNRLYRVRVLP